MVVLLIVLLMCVALVFVMVKQAFENNVLHHELQLTGDFEEQVSIFFISDVHVRKINSDMIQQIEKKIHAVIIGGDFVDKRTPITHVYENIELLKKLGTVYFIWGNNDREVGEETLRGIFRETSVQIVENDSVAIPNNLNKCRLSAIDDTSSKQVDLEKAFQHCSKSDNVIFVSHNPSMFDRARKYDPKLMLGGHLHGGQIRFGPISMHPHGSFQVVDGVYSLVSNGYGTTMIPMRFGAKPQCHIIDLNFVK